MNQNQGTAPLLSLEPLMTAKEVAAVLRGATYKSVLEMRKRKELPAANIAGKWMFERADVRAYIDAQKAAAASS